MFQLAVAPTERGGWALAPSEFWGMTIREWWVVYDAMIGKAAQAEQATRDRLHKLLKDSK